MTWSFTTPNSRTAATTSLFCAMKSQSSFILIAKRLERRILGVIDQEVVLATFKGMARTTSIPSNGRAGVSPVPSMVSLERNEKTGWEG